MTESHSFNDAFNSVFSFDNATLKFSNYTGTLANTRKQSISSPSYQNPSTNIPSNDLLEKKRLTFKGLKIFTELAKIDSYEQTGSCNVCKKAVKSKTDIKSNCQFCGKQVCSEHMRSGKRVNPENKEDHARICKDCHKKWIDKYILDPYWKKNGKVQNLVNKRECDVNILKDKLNTIGDDIMRLKQLAKGRQDSVDNEMSNIRVEKENLMDEMKELQANIDRKIIKELSQEKKIEEGYQKMKELEDERNDLAREDGHLREELGDVEEDCADLMQRIEEETFKMSNYKKTVMSLGGRGSFNQNSMQDLLRPKNETIFGDKMRLSKISGDLSSSKGSDYRMHQKKDGYPYCSMF